MESLAPICLFTYNRIEETIQTLEALKANFLAKESILFIFSDGAKNEKDFESVNQVRTYLKSVNGFKEIHIYESSVNKGLANSIISGVTDIVTQFGKIIVLEDDLITSRNFLDFMNQCLEFYAQESKVLSVSGFSFSDNLNLGKYDNRFGYRASSWGWGTWVDRWLEIDWTVAAYKGFKSNYLKRMQFNKGGSDMALMLDRQMNAKINSWAIRFCFHQYRHKLVDVYPVCSKVMNIGFGNKATNSFNGAKRFCTRLDESDSRNFVLSSHVSVSIYDALCFYWHYSYATRLLSKLEKVSHKLKSR